ncbi:MAG: FAD-dependent oxidoreductase [Hyphomicrobiales bacterium]
MRRDLDRLSDGAFDVAVVGGGIFGIFAAWDAALRGLSVAIVERTDWAQAASANCFKMVHGGIRYLQHGDVRRVRESSRERTALLRIAGHQVRPLPILIPTYGHGRSGKEILAAGLAAYDLLTWDRNRGLRDPGAHIPPGRLLGRRDVLDLYPDLAADGLTGGALFHDAQMASPARLALCVLRSAVDKGAQAANYVAATGFIREGDRITGVRVRDRETDRDFAIRARFVVNAAGAWSEPLLDSADSLRPATRSTFSRDAFFVLPRRVGPPVALAVKGRTRDPDAFLSREARHLFLVPWRKSTIVGVWHVVYTGDPDRVTLPEQDLREFIDEINWAYPGLDARPEEVTVAPHGLVLFGENDPGARNLRYGHRSRVIDHAREQGVHGLVTLIGVRYTTARLEAERVIDLIVERLGARVRPCATATTPVHGGMMDHAEAYGREAEARKPPSLEPETVRSLVRAHGVAYGEVFDLARSDARLARLLEGTDVIGAEVVYAARSEMARRLADVVCRRTHLGDAATTPAAALTAAADLMAAEMGWSAARRDEELRATAAQFRRNGMEAGTWT